MEVRAIVWVRHRLVQGQDEGSNQEGASKGWEESGFQHLNRHMDREEAGTPRKFQLCELRDQK